MKRLAFVTLLAVGVGLSIGAIGSDAAAILKEIDGLKRPAFDQKRQSDPAYEKEYMAAYYDFADRRNDLILKLYREAPDNERTAPLMLQRWSQLDQKSSGEGEKYALRVIADIDKILAENAPEPVREAGDYARVQTKLNFIPAAQQAPLATVDEFVKAHPKSTKCASLLVSASYMAQDTDRRAIYERVVKDYPDYEMIGLIKGGIRQLDGVGKPFDLKFKDAVSGNDVNIASMKGKVVMIDFWATWCGPCVAEMPHVKKVYEALHGKGFEIIGVSLDNKDGGLDKLKDYVAKNAIPWPQYYQGNGWDSEFSASWGIMSIPCTFLVDKSGKLSKINAQDLEATVNAMLAAKG